MGVWGGDAVMLSGIFFVSRTHVIFRTNVPIDVVIHDGLWLSDWAVFYCQLTGHTSKTGGEDPLRLTVGFSCFGRHKKGVLQSEWRLNRLVSKEMNHV